MMSIIHKLPFFILLLFLSQTVLAQNKVLFTYDDSGNRIQRSAEEVQEPVPEATMFLEKDTVVTEFTDSSAISIYRDNIAETINVKLANKRDNSAMMGGYTLYDSSGRRIKKSQSHMAEFCIELSSLPQGIYVIHINCGNIVVSRKFRLK